MNGVQTAATALSDGKVDAIMIQHDHRLHSGDNPWLQHKLRLALELMQGLVHNTAQENSEMKHYCHHLGALKGPKTLVTSLLPVSWGKETMTTRGDVRCGSR